MKKLLFIVLLLILNFSFIYASGGSEDTDELSVGLIIKTETNPFFIKIKEEAEKKAEELGITLITASGNYDGDLATQITAMENMINRGVSGILLLASDSQGIVPVVNKARENGIVVIALDSPLTPIDASDGLFATDNFKAGFLIGEWAKYALGDKPIKLASIDAFPGFTVDYLRHNGFMAGLGLIDLETAKAATEDLVTSEVVCQVYTGADLAESQTATENCLTKDPSINVVYGVNEPTILGAYSAVKNAGRDDIFLVSVDGGCEVSKMIGEGKISASAQQYPGNMAILGIEAIKKYFETGVKPSGYVDTGVKLITNLPQKGLENYDP